jgi:tRNA-dihydrouridine synthase
MKNKYTSSNRKPQNTFPTIKPGQFVRFRFHVLDVTGKHPQGPRILVFLRRLNQDLGAQIIDINMGCPVKKVVNGYAGSALMRDENLAARIIEATVKAVSVPVTLKNY